MAKAPTILPKDLTVQYQFPTISFVISRSVKPKQLNEVVFDRPVEEFTHFPIARYHELIGSDRSWLLMSVFLGTYFLLPKHRIYPNIFLRLKVMPEINSKYCSPFKLVRLSKNSDLSCQECWNQRINQKMLDPTKVQKVVKKLIK